MTYEDAGVSIDRGGEFVRGIRTMVESTHDEYVIPNYRGFAGLYKLGAYLRDKEAQEIAEDIARRLKRKYGKEKAQYIVAVVVKDCRRTGKDVCILFEEWLNGKRKTRKMTARRIRRTA